METQRSQCLAAAIPALVLTFGVGHAVTPAQKCQSGKNKAVGQYSACRQQPEANFAASLDSAKRTQSLAKCAAKLQATWAELEAKSLAQGVFCPSVGDQAAVQAAVDQQSATLAITLGGGSAPAMPVGQVLKTGQTRCFAIEFPWDNKTDSYFVRAVRGGV